MSKRKSLPQSTNLMPVMPGKCATCPFREGSATGFLRDYLTEASGRETRICHNTGKGNAFHEDTGKPERVCRGSRDLQLRFFHQCGFLPEPTDAAWSAKWAELQGENRGHSESDVQPGNTVRRQESVPVDDGRDAEGEDHDPPAAMEGQSPAYL